jgi:hypothetical protein
LKERNSLLEEEDEEFYPLLLLLFEFKEVPENILFD